MKENREINKKEEDAPLQQKKSSDEFKEIDIGNNKSNVEETTVKKDRINIILYRGC